MPNVRELVAEMDRKARIRERRKPGDRPPGPWHAIPMDIMRLIVDRMRPVDVQATLLVCREWHDGFASGILALKPRALKVDKLAARCGAHCYSKDVLQLQGKVRGSIISLNQ